MTMISRSLNYGRGSDQNLSIRDYNLLNLVYEQCFTKTVFWLSNTVSLDSCMNGRSVTVQSLAVADNCFTRLLFWQSQSPLAIPYLGSLSQLQLIWDGKIFQFVGQFQLPSASFRNSYVRNNYSPRHKIGVTPLRFTVIKKNPNLNAYSLRFNYLLRYSEYSYWISKSDTMQSLNLLKLGLNSGTKVIIKVCSAACNQIQRSQAGYQLWSIRR